MPGYLFRRIGPPQAPWAWSNPGVPPADAVADAPTFAPLLPRLPISYSRSDNRWHFATVPPVDAAPETPPPFAALTPSHAPGYLRAANQSYTITPRLASIGDASEVPPRWLMPVRATGALRAASTAYLARMSGPPLDVSEFAQELLRGLKVPQSAPGARRAAVTSYWIDQRTNAVLGDEVYGLRTISFPSVARGPSRASSSAYLISVSFSTPDVELPVTHQVFPRTAPAARRASSSAYDVSAHVPPPDEVYGLTVMLVSLPWRPLPRSTPDSYWLDNRLAVAALQDTPISTVLFQHAAPGAMRSSVTSYWLPQRTNTFIGDEVYGLTLHSVPSRAPGALRAANPSYWVHAEQPPLDIVAPTIQTVCPSVARGSSLSSSSAYFVHADQPPAALAPPTIQTHYPSVARGPLRSGSSAYLVSVTFVGPDFVPPPPFVASLQPIGLVPHRDTDISVAQLRERLQPDPIMVSPRQNPDPPTLGSRRV